MIVGGRDFRVQYNRILVKLVQKLKKGRRKRKAGRAQGRTRGRRCLPSAMGGEDENVYVYKPGGVSNTY